MFNLFESLLLRVQQICAEHQHVTPTMKADLLAAVQNFYLDVAQRLRDQITLLLGDLPAEAKSEGATQNNFDRLILKLVELCVEGRPIDAAFMIQVKGAITSFNAHLCRGLHKSITLLLVPATPHPELLTVTASEPPAMEPPPLELPDHLEEPTTDPGMVVDDDLRMPDDPTPHTSLVGGVVNEIVGTPLPVLSADEDDPDQGVPSPPESGERTRQIRRRPLIAAPRTGDGEGVVLHQRRTEGTASTPELTTMGEDDLSSPLPPPEFRRDPSEPLSPFTPISPEGERGDSEQTSYLDTRLFRKQMMSAPSENEGLHDSNAVREEVQRHLPPEAHFNVGEFPQAPGPAASESGTMTWVAASDHPQPETTTMVPAERDPFEPVAGKRVRHPTQVAITRIQDHVPGSKSAASPLEVVEGAGKRVAKSGEISDSPPSTPPHVDEHATMQPGWRKPQKPSADDAEFHTVIAPIKDLMAKPEEQPEALDPRLIRVQADPKKPDNKK